MNSPAGENNQEQMAGALTIKRLYKNYLSQDWDTSDRIFLFISVNGDVHTPNIEQQVEIVPPTVDGTPSVSGAGTDAQWSVGETVGVTVTFSEAVDVDTSGGDAVHRHWPGRPRRRATRRTRAGPGPRSSCSSTRWFQETARTATWR